MASFLLIHGAWHGAWCWYKVIPELEALGHHALAIDLPSHGRDITSVAEVTLDSYGESVAAALRDLTGPVHLVGHSMGGAVITQTVDKAADKIKSLTYLTAFLGEDGDSLSSVIAVDNTSILPAALIAADDGTMSVRPEALKEVFYHDCSNEDVQLAKLCLTPQSSRAVAEPLRVSKEKFDRITRHYILCSEDRAISEATQRAMIEKIGCDKVTSMQTSHSPFFSKPVELAATLAMLVD
jgi:pimeloyl-ACP methyl ester carboxylesterase